MITHVKKIVPYQIKSLISRHWEAERTHRVNKKYRGAHLEKYIHSVDELTYQELKRYREAEHQIGRFLNMKKILRKVKELDLKGDLVEFGTWQGQGLRLFDLASQDKIDKKLVGIDSFEGLPETSTIWKKGAFSNTSYEQVENRLIKSTQNFSGVNLIKGWFNDPAVAKNLYDIVDDVAIVHLDADLGSSTLQALAILEPYFQKRKQPMYLLFDDWGCHPNEVPEAFNTWINEAKKRYNMQTQMLYFTNLTRYYELSFE
jgi:hypothetical protein